MKPNPFKPTAGGNPPRMIGRDNVVRDFEKGIVNGAGAPGRLMVVTGARGTGKTVMLADLAGRARSHRWEVISETGSDGLCVRLVEALLPKKSRLDKLVIKPEISAFGLGGSLGEIDLARKTMPSTLRQAFAERLGKLGKKNVGLLVTIDEAQAASRDDLVAISTAVQHLVSENLDVAIVFAGLPGLVSDLLNDDVLTFMRRAKQEVLLDVPIDQVCDSFTDTFGANGVSISPQQALKAAQGTYGYPYMIQLVGYAIWDNVVSDDGRKESVVLDDDVDHALVEATGELDRAVCEPELADLSEGALAYLEALARFNGPAATADVAASLQWTPQYANTYRRRLLDAHVLLEVRRGVVDFALPYLRAYLLRRDE